MAGRTICKECRHCTGIYYNGIGEVSIYCRLHSGTGIVGDPLRYEILSCPDFELPNFNKECWLDNGTFNPDYLPKLRKQIVPGSMYIDDYRNEYGINPEYLCAFFDEYLEWLDDSTLDDSDDALIDWYTNASNELTTDNLIQNPIIK